LQEINNANKELNGNQTAFVVYERMMDSSFPMRLFYLMLSGGLLRNISELKLIISLFQTMKIISENYR
jgi:hypothetical protein